VKARDRVSVLTWPNDRETGPMISSKRETHAVSEHRMICLIFDHVKFAGIHARIGGRVDFFCGGGFSSSFSLPASLLEELAPVGSVSGPDFSLDFPTSSPSAPWS